LRQQASSSSVNGAKRGGKNNGGFNSNFNSNSANSFRGRGGGGRGDRGGRGRGNGGARGFSNKPRLTCQLCGKIDHVVADCWHRYDESFVPDFRTAAAASYGVDTNWYMDIGATDHITGELEKLSTHEKYNGKDQIHTASGACMNIKHIGHSTIHTPVRNIYLKNILHVPKAKKNLISAHRLAVDNNAFVEVHSRFFAIKDQVTKNLLLRGPCRNGFYPLPTSSFSSSKQVLGVVKPTYSKWHSRLGHPSLAIVQKIVSNNKLPCLGEINELGVCDACQQAKSHQLPYPKSSSVSSHPLELVFSDV
jgi:histone deacetylase 1/2